MVGIDLVVFVLLNNFLLLSLKGFLIHGTLSKLFMKYLEEAKIAICIPKECSTRPVNKKVNYKTMAVRL